MTAGAARSPSWLPGWELIATKNLEIRRRRGLVVTAAVLILLPTLLVDGARLLFHAFDPHSFGPAGSPALFSQLTNTTAEFGFIAAAAFGAAAATTDLTDGMFRHLVVTGRSRLALYLARIPAGLVILIPLVAAGFGINCLVTGEAGSPPATSVGLYGLTVPQNLDQAGLQTWLLQHPQEDVNGLPVGPTVTPAQIPSLVDKHIGDYYSAYTSDEAGGENPSDGEMAKIGLWLELEIGVGFFVGLGLGSLTGQRTTTTIVLIALEIIVTPLLAHAQIPYIIDGQRAVIGVAMDQLRPAALAAGTGTGGGGGGPGQLLLGGRGALGIPPMPAWAMVTVIVGWIVGWSVIGAWRMKTRDA